MATKGDEKLLHTAVPDHFFLFHVPTSTFVEVPMSGFKPGIYLQQEIRVGGATSALCWRYREDASWRETLIAQAIQSAREAAAALLDGDPAEELRHHQRLRLHYGTALLLFGELGGQSISLEPKLTVPLDLQIAEWVHDRKVLYIDVLGQAAESLLATTQFTVSASGASVFNTGRGCCFMFDWNRLVRLGWRDQMLAYLTYRSDLLVRKWNESIEEDHRLARLVLNSAGFSQPLARAS